MEPRQVVMGTCFDSLDHENWNQKVNGLSSTDDVKQDSKSLIDKWRKWTRHQGLTQIFITVHLKGRGIFIDRHHEFLEEVGVPMTLHKVLLGLERTKFDPVASLAEIVLCWAEDHIATLARIMHLEYADILKLIREAEASMLAPEQSHYEPCAFADLAEVASEEMFIVEPDVVPTEVKEAPDARLRRVARAAEIEVAQKRRRRITQDRERQAQRAREEAEKEAALRLLEEERRAAEEARAQEEAEKKRALAIANVDLEPPPDPAGAKVVDLDLQLDKDISGNSQGGLNRSRSKASGRKSMKLPRKSKALPFNYDPSESWKNPDTLGKGFGNVGTLGPSETADDMSGKQASKEPWRVGTGGTAGGFSSYSDFLDVGGAGGGVDPSNFLRSGQTELDKERDPFRVPGGQAPAWSQLEGRGSLGGGPASEDHRGRSGEFKSHPHRFRASLDGSPAWQRMDIGALWEPIEEEAPVASRPANKQGGGVKGAAESAKPEPHYQAPTSDNQGAAPSKVKMLSRMGNANLKSKSFNLAPKRVTGNGGHLKSLPSLAPINNNVQSKGKPGRVATCSNGVDDVVDNTLISQISMQDNAHVNETCSSAQDSLEEEWEVSRDLSSSTVSSVGRQGSDGTSALPVPRPVRLTVDASQEDANEAKDQGPSSYDTPRTDPGSCGGGRIDTPGEARLHGSLQDNLFGATLSSHRVGKTFDAKIRSTTSKYLTESSADSDVRFVTKVHQWLQRALHSQLDEDVIPEWASLLFNQGDARQVHPTQDVVQDDLVNILYSSLFGASDWGTDARMVMAEDGSALDPLQFLSALRERDSAQQLRALKDDAELAQAMLGDNSEILQKVLRIMDRVIQRKAERDMKLIVRYRSSKPHRLPSTLPHENLVFDANSRPELPMNTDLSIVDIGFGSQHSQRIHVARPSLDQVRRERVSEVVPSASRYRVSTVDEASATDVPNFIDDKLFVSASVASSGPISRSSENPLSCSKDQFGVMLPSYSRIIVSKPVDLTLGRVARCSSVAKTASGQDTMKLSKSYTHISSLKAAKDTQFEEEGGPRTQGLALLGGALRPVVQKKIPHPNGLSPNTSLIRAPRMSEQTISSRRPM